MEGNVINRLYCNKVTLKAVIHRLNSHKSTTIAAVWYSQWVYEVLGTSIAAIGEVDIGSQLNLPEAA